MSETLLDDTDSKISYSSGWDIQRGESRQYQSTAHSSKDNNTRATIKWRGTGARIYGTMPIGSGEVRWKWTLDGVSHDETRHTHSLAYYDDVMADTGSLEEGLHTLVIKPSNTEEPLVLDRWLVWLSGQQPWDVSSPAPTPTSITTLQITTATTTTPMPGTTTRQQPGQGTTSDNIITTTETHFTQQTSNIDQQPSTTSSGSSSSATITSTTSSSETSHLSQVVQVKSFTTTDVNGNTQASTSVIPAVTEFVTTPGEDNPLPIGAIIGLVIGGIVIVLLFALVSLLLWRRRHSSQRVFQASPESPPETSERSTTWLQRQVERVNGVTPFELAQTTTGRAATSFPISVPPTKAERSFFRLPDDEAFSSRVGPAPAESLSNSISSGRSESQYPSPYPRDENGKLPPPKTSSTSSTQSGRATAGRDTPISPQIDVFRDPFIRNRDCQTNAIGPASTFSSALVVDVGDAPPAYPGLPASMNIGHR